MVAALLFRVMDEQSAEVAEAVRDTVMPKWEKEGAVSLGLFGSSKEENNYPILRFIEDEEVIAWFASFESRSAFEAASAAVRSTLAPFEAFVLWWEKACRERSDEQNRSEQRQGGWTDHGTSLEERFVGVSDYALCPRADLAESQTGPPEV